MLHLVAMLVGAAYVTSTDVYNIVKKISDFRFYGWESDVEEKVFDLTLVFEKKAGYAVSRDRILGDPMRGRGMTCVERAQSLKRGVELAGYATRDATTVLQEIEDLMNAAIDKRSE